MADRTGIDILTLRPRATELYQLGFLKLVEDEASVSPSPSLPVSKSAHEGTYEACTLEEAMATFQANVRAARDPQLEIISITNQLPTG